MNLKKAFVHHVKVSDETNITLFHLANIYYADVTNIGFRHALLSPYLQMLPAKASIHSLATLL